MRCDPYSFLSKKAILPRPSVYFPDCRTSLESTPTTISMPTHHQPFKSVLHYSKSILPKYQATLLQQKKLQTIIKECLPDNLSAHVHHCVASGPRILLFTDSANWATHLRFFQQQIIRSINAAGYPQLDNLRIRITSPLSQKNNASTRRKRIPSQKNIDIIRQHALQQTDPKLNRSLLRLSATLRNRSDQD